MPSSDRAQKDLSLDKASCSPGTLASRRCRGPKAGRTTQGHHLSIDSWNEPNKLEGDGLFLQEGEQTAASMYLGSVLAYTHDRLSLGMCSFHRALDSRMHLHGTKAFQLGGNFFN